MMQTFNLSFFKNKRDATPQVVERSWQQLCEQFKTPEVRLEKDGLLFSPAKFEPAHRLNKNVREISMLVLDIDHNAELETLKAKLAAFDSAYVIYSTHSHLRRTEKNSNAEPRFRVCLPLELAIPANDFPALWQYAKQKIGLPSDENAKDVARMFYVPAIARLDAPYVFELKDGLFLDWRKLPLDSFSANGSANGDNREMSDAVIFDFNEDRHTELCRRIASQAKATGRGTFEMKCPAHNGNGNSSLFHDPTTQSVACIRKPNPCSYFEILSAFGLQNERLPSRENKQKTPPDAEEIETRIKPFPVPNEKCFYGLAGDFVRLVEPHTEASRMALLAQFLVYFGNIIGRSAYYKIEGDKQFTNCFCVLVGKTASGRKGTSFGRVKEVFRGLDERHETECVVSGLASGEGLLYHIRDATFKTNKDGEVIADAGVSDKRLLVVEGEFANVLRVQGREGNTLSAFIRNLWDSGNARSLTKSSPLRTTNAQVSIIGHITQTELLITLSEVESANGYANRFMFFAVERDKFLPHGSDIGEIEIGKLRRRISEAIEFAKDIEQMKLSNDARNLWAAGYKRLETSRFGYLAKVTQRASPYVLRLACIFALLDESNQIEQIHLETALSVWQYSENSARYIFGEKLDDHTADKILNALRENKATGLTRTDIRDLFDRNAGKQKIDTALQYLVEADLAHFEKQQTKGKPKEIWFADDNDINDQTDQTGGSSENEKSFVVNVVNVVTEATNKQCPTCEKELDITYAGNLFCPLCLTSY